MCLSLNEIDIVYPDMLRSNFSHFGDLLVGIADRPVNGFTIYPEEELEKLDMQLTNLDLESLNTNEVCGYPW